MRSPLFRFPVAVFALVSLLGLAACGDGNVYGDSYDPAAALDLAPVPPPPPSEEDKPILSDPRTHVWRAGHWEYEFQHFVWVPGEVLTRPSSTAVWSPDRWEHRMYGWAFISGYWQ